MIVKRTRSEQRQNASGLLRRLKKFAGPKWTAALLTSAFLATASIPASASSSKNGASEPVALNSEITVQGDAVRLGDVFQNAGQYSDRQITRAPSPGSSLTLEARWLGKVARAFKLDWRPTSSFDSALVTRVSQAIDANTIQTEINHAVLSRLARSGTNRPGVEELIEIELDNRLLTLHVPTDRPASLALQQLEIDPRTDRFTALVVAPKEPPYATRLAVSGQIHRMIEVPTPVRRIMRGDIISGRDIQMIRVRHNRIGGNVLMDPADIIGQSAKQTLSQGRMIGASALQPPVLVKKKSLLTVSLVSGALQLTARAKAMEDGSEGDVIRVMNLQSERIFEAQVTGLGTAIVASPSQIALR